MKNLFCALFLALCSCADAQQPQFKILTDKDVVYYPGGIPVLSIEVTNFDQESSMDFRVITDPGFEVFAGATYGAETKTMDSPEKYTKDRLRHKAIRITPYLNSHVIILEVSLQVDFTYESDCQNSRNKSLSVPVNIFFNDSVLFATNISWRPKLILFQQFDKYGYVEDALWHRSIMLPYRVDDVGELTRIYGIKETILWTEMQSRLIDSLTAICDTLCRLSSVYRYETLDGVRVTFGAGGLNRYAVQIDVPNPFSSQIADWKRWNLIKRNGITVSTQRLYERIKSLQGTALDIEKLLLDSIEKYGIVVYFEKCGSSAIHRFILKGKTLRKWRSAILHAKKKLNKEKYLRN